MVIQSLPYVAVLGFLYGSTLLVSRFSVGQFQPSTYIGLRFTLAGLGHAAIYLFAQKRHWPRDRQLWRHAVLLGVVGTAVPMTSIVTSLKYQSSGVTALLLTTGPAITVVLAHFFLSDERLTRAKMIGVLLAFSGAGLLAIRGESGLAGGGRAAPLGYGLVLFAMVCSSSGTIYARRYLSQYDAFDVASIRMFAAALTVMPLSAIFIGFDLHAVNSSGFIALGYAAAVGTFSGLLMAFYIIKRFGATSSSMTSYVVPIVATVGGVLFLAEKVTPSMLVGMALILTGLTILRGRKDGQIEAVRSSHWHA